MINPEDPIYIDRRTSCTKDEAVAKLLGWMQGDIRRKYILVTLDGISPESLPHMHSLDRSIWDLLTEQREIAQLAYSDAFDENATVEVLYEKEKNILRWQETITKAKSYQRDIDDELANGIGSFLKVYQTESASSGVTHISISTLDRWAMKKYGISVLDYSKSKFIEKDTDEHTATAVPAVEAPVAATPVSWEDVTIKIYAGYKIGVKLGKNKFEKSTYQKIGLLGSRKNQPNDLGGILLGLSQNLKYPPSQLIDDKYKTAMSKLRKSLRQLTGISEDPFFPFNEGDGWKPRFTLIDDRRNADERAKTEAEHVQYDDLRDDSPETPDFEFEHDDAQRFISAKEHEKFTRDPDK